MLYRNLELNIRDRIACIVLNRPERRNALSLELMLELTNCLARISERADIAAVILGAAGKVFSSGHDLSELQGRSEAEYNTVFGACGELMQQIQNTPQPVIAAVQGLATAAGCQLVASCDLAVASEEASFATPGVKIGLFCSTPMVALTRAIGRKRAMEMLLTGRPISARLAAEWGLVNRVAPAGQLEEATLELAGEIVRASGETIRTGKQAFYAQVELSTAAAYSHTSAVMTRNSLSADAQEGISAFLEKRKPQWRT